MHRYKISSCIGSLLIFGFLLFMGAGCTKYASEENLKQLEVQQQAAISAEQKRDNLIKEKRKLEALKAEKEMELEAAQIEKAEVSKRLEARKAAEAESEGDAE